MKRKLISLMLVLCLLASLLLPTYALESDEAVDAEPTEDVCEHPDEALDSRTIPPTCTESGHNQEYCTLCGEVLIDVLTHPLGHSWLCDGQFTIVNGEHLPYDPDTDGNVMHYSHFTCQRCGMERTEQNPPVEPCTHPDEALDCIIVESTCTEPGSKQIYCTLCGEELSTEVIPAGHRYETVVHEPTFTTEGEIIYTCTLCGDTYSESIAVPEQPFTDVVDGAYYMDAVAWALSHNVTSGTSDTTFSPNKPCTRGQIVTFLWRAMGCPEHTSEENPFADVTADAFYYDAVLWAVENGITTGTGESTFAPFAPCTRAQIVTFIWRAKGSPEPTGAASPFTDILAGEFYYNAVLWAAENHVTTGTGTATFSPALSCTRAQAVTLLFGALTQHPVQTVRPVVCLSPSNQDENRYAYGNTNEAEQCQRIADAAAVAFERCGITVVMADSSLTITEKCKLSDEAGADLHWPIHTNAHGSYGGTSGGTHMYAASATGEGGKACAAVLKYLAPLTPGSSGENKVHINTSWWEINLPNAPTIFQETEFHDIPEYAKWIIEHVEDIAEAMAMGACEYFDLTYIPPQN